MLNWLKNKYFRKERYVDSSGIKEPVYFCDVCVGEVVAVSVKENKTYALPCCANCRDNFVLIFDGEFNLEDFKC